MADYNRGFLRLMMKEIIPRAGQAEDVTKLVMKIIQTPNPKGHYVIGKDARFTLTAKKLGLLGLLEKAAIKKLNNATRREKRRLEQKRNKRKST